MALTNIELYEALKRDLSEESARMIAEAVPPAEGLATKADFASLRAEFANHAMAIEQRLAATDRRMGQLGYALLIPVWAACIAAVLKFLLGGYKFLLGG